MIEALAILAAVWTVLPIVLAVVGAFWLAGRLSEMD